MTKQRWPTAIHESAHAVACHAFGGRIDKLVIYDDVVAMDGMSGEAIGHARLTPQESALVSLAGPAAEHRFHYPYMQPGRGDIENATRLLAGTGLRIKDIWPRAQRFVELYRPRILYVARELYRTGSLDGDQFVALMRHRTARSWSSPRW